MPRHAIAIGLWVAAWFFSGFIPASFFAARDGRRAAAATELVIGMAGAAGFAWAGAVLW